MKKLILLIALIPAFAFADFDAQLKLKFKTMNYYESSQQLVMLSNKGACNLNCKEGTYHLAGGTFKGEIEPAQCEQLVNIMMEHHPANLTMFYSLMNKAITKIEIE